MVSLERARFITLEGGEAAGKTTQVGLLEARLQALGYRVLTTREPGGTPLGEAIRHLLKYAPEGRDMSAEAELLLFQASRAELVRKVIAPALLAGTWVLSDRFVDSTTVYQGAGRGLSAEFVAHSTQFAIGETLPGLTLVFDLSPDEARHRQRARTPLSMDRMEDQSLEFYQRVQSGYRTLAEENPERIRSIPAGGSVEETAALLWKEVAHAFSL